MRCCYCEFRKMIFKFVVLITNIGDDFLEKLLT